MTTPKINPNAIELLSRPFSSHKMGLPEWMKNAREAYLRASVPPESRYVIINYQRDSLKPYIECIDFVGISGADLETHYLEWANPDAAGRGLSAGMAEGGQGSGGKAYLRQMFEDGFFASVVDQRLSVVKFTDTRKFNLYFVPDAASGKDAAGENPVVQLRATCSAWLKAYDQPPGSNITIVRGISPLKPVDLDRLVDEIQQFPQARETIRTCRVCIHLDGKFLVELAAKEMPLHPEFPEPVCIDIPEVLLLDGKTVRTSRLPEYPPGQLVLRIAPKPLMGQVLRNWNRIDFHGTGVRVIAFEELSRFSLKEPQFATYLSGDCTLPLLVDPAANYELQARRSLNDGDLKDALYAFIEAEAGKLVEKLARQVTTHVASRRRKNLEKLNARLAAWIESKLETLSGIGMGGLGGGLGKRGRTRTRGPEPKAAMKLRIHREAVDICSGVDTYALRAVAYDAEESPVPHGKLVWRSSNPRIVAVHPETGVLDAKEAGIATVAVENDAGLTAKPTRVQVYEAAQLRIRLSSPVALGSNRRLPIPLIITTPRSTTVKDAVVNWRSSDPSVATVGQDGTLVGGEVGVAEVVAYAGATESAPFVVNVEQGAGGKPRGGGKGRPQILLSGQVKCPFDGSDTTLMPSDPPVYQRPHKSDYASNIFWVNLQHPLAAKLLASGEGSVQWRTYHFERVLEVYKTLELRRLFGETDTLNVDDVLEEIQVAHSKLYAEANEEIFDLLYSDTLDLASV